MLKLYTQNNCQYCSILKERLTKWGISFKEINISEDSDSINHKQFLKDNGHYTVPQLYLSYFNINEGINTLDFTEKTFYDRLDKFIDTHSKEQVDEVIRLYDRNKGESI